jgi:cleavage and polyadenylation specificity factor subunit 1
MVVCDLLPVLPSFIALCSRPLIFSFLDLGLSQMLPMLDEETGAEPRVLSASIADPYLLLIRDDSSVFVAQIDSNNELEEVDRDDTSVLSNTKWLSGCLYTDSSGIFSPVAKGDGTKDNKRNIFMFLLSASGSLQVSFISRIQELATNGRHV